jgi:broad specificity phosphatase PhoE
MGKEEVKVNIYLIRHGEKSEDGSSLTERGSKQVLFLSKRLAKIGLNKIISSDIPRCIATTKTISKYIKTNIVFDEGLREVEGFVKEHPEKHKQEIRKIQVFWNRVTKERGNVLLVGSGNVNRILIALALKINPKNSRFVQNPTGLTHLEYINKNRTRIAFVNDMSHLPESLKERQAY